MLTKKYSIIEAFTRKPWKALTFKQVKKLAKNRSDNYVHTVLKELVKDNILTQEKIGSSIIYSIANNLFALNTIGYISEYKSNNAKHLPYKNIKKFLDNNYNTNIIFFPNF